MTDPVPLIRIRARRGWAALEPRELWAYRDVLLMLAARDLKLRYRQTGLGVAWVVLQPLVAGLIFALVFGHFARLPSGGHPYLLFVFTGMLGWNLFAGVVQRAGNSLVAEARLITKVYFPRMLIPLAAALAAMVDFAVSLVALAGLLAWHRVWPGGGLLLLPMAVALVAALAFGVSLWVAALNVRYRDFAYALPFVLQIWMYASPVVYGPDLLPESWRGWYWFNPMAGALEALRAALLNGESMPWRAVAATSLLAAAVLLPGAYYFRRAERDFADSL